MSDQNNTQTMWATVGKVGVAFATLVSVMGTAFYIYDRFSQRPDLQMVVSIREFETPQPETKPPLSIADPERDANKTEAFRDMEHFFEGIGTRVFFRASIANVGSTQAEEVVVSLPGFGQAEIVGVDGETKSLEYSGRIELGKILAGDSVILKAWPRVGLSIDAADLVVRHKAGFGAVRIRQETDGFWQMLWDRCRSVLKGLLILVPLLLISLVVAGWPFRTRAHAMRAKDDIKKVDSSAPHR